MKYLIAVKTWQRVFESQLPKNINLNGITGFCVRRNSESDKRSQLFIRTDKNAAEGEFIFWPLLLNSIWVIQIGLTEDFKIKYNFKVKLLTRTVLFGMANPQLQLQMIMIILMSKKCLISLF